MAAVLVALAGCGCGDAQGGDDGLPREEDAAGGDRPAIDGEGSRVVDMLFVIDNSGSLAEEQQRLRAQFERLIGIITSGDQTPEDGVEVDKDFPRVTDLHLGVVSTDMGSPYGEQGRDPEGRCTSFGDDGVLQHSPHSSTSGCDGEYPAFLSCRPDADDARACAESLSCMASLGTGGCGFEAPLEAALKAVWPSADDALVFRDNSSGHGDVPPEDGGNGGFVRDNSLLAIIVLTDEDDCSTVELDGPLSGMSPCEYSDPTQRYVDGLKALRKGENPSVMFAAITGVPADFDEYEFDVDGDGFLDEREAEEYYGALLAHPDMQDRIDPEATGALPGSACTIDNPDFDPADPLSQQFFTRAAPARRIVEVARGFGPNGVVRSICQEDLGSAVDAIIRTMARAW